MELLDPTLRGERPMGCRGRTGRNIFQRVAARPSNAACFGDKNDPERLQKESCGGKGIGEGV